MRGIGESRPPGLSRCPPTSGREAPPISERRGSDLLVLRESYYRILPAGDGWAKLVGQFYYAHSVYPPEYPKVLRPTHIDAKDVSKTRFVLKAYSDGDECHIPSRELGLEEDELHYVYVGKRRLVIVLGSCAQTWYPSEKEQIILLCAPVFSFKARQSQEFVLRSQAFDFPNLFYLPPDTDGCTSESAVRFEYIQPIMASCLHPQVGVLSRQPVALTDMARDLMLVHLSRFLGLGVAAPGTEAILADIKLYHDLLMEQLQKPTAK